MARILLIDDSQSVLTALSTGLRQDGFEVACLSLFMDLASTIESFAPEVIILDLLMPGFNGVQFARFIQKYCDHPPPIILHSGSDPEMIRIAAREIRPFEIIQKGAPLRDIRRAVSRALASAKGWTPSSDATQRTSRSSSGEPR